MSTFKQNSYDPSRFDFITFSEDDLTGGDIHETIGGATLVFKAAASLALGDAVCITAANTVNKSTTATVHQSRVGIVVGGRQTYYKCMSQKTLYSQSAPIVAALTNEEVFVLIQGFIWCIGDATIGIGVRIAPSTGVAGQVRPATDPVVAAGATPVTSTAANGAIITGDGFNRILGINPGASVALNVTFRAFINLA